VKRATPIGAAVSGEVSFCDRQVRAVKCAVTPLVGLSINATTPMLHFFSTGDDVQGRATYARFG
jgi:hypothetical protein